MVHTPWYPNLQQAEGELTNHPNYLDFGSLDNMKITSSEPKEYLGRPGKGLITSVGLKTIVRSKKNKKVRYVITTNISLKEILKIIR